VRAFLQPAMAAALGITGVAFAQDGAQPPLPSSVEAKWAEAEVERVPPSEALALGHHGTVVLEGDVSPEGRAVNLAIARSSRSPILDAAALQRFANARLGADLLAEKPQKIRLKIVFGNYDFDNLGLGYLCAQAVREADWYKVTFPEQSFEDTKFKTYLRSMALIDNRMAFANDRDRFETVWRDTIALCRDRPAAPIMGLVVLVGTGKVPAK